jgi:hypothetical protein
MSTFSFMFVCKNQKPIMIVDLKKQDYGAITLVVRSSDGLEVSFEIPHDMRSSTEASLVAGVATRFDKPFEWVWSDCDGYGSIMLSSEKFELTSDGNSDVTGIMTVGGSFKCPMNDAIIEMLQTYLTMVTVTPDPPKVKKTKRL